MPQAPYLSLSLTHRSQNQEHQVIYLPNQFEKEKGVLDLNSIFGIKNTNFIIGFKKMIKLVRLVLG